MSAGKLGQRLSRSRAGDAVSRLLWHLTGRVGSDAHPLSPLSLGQYVSKSIRGCRWLYTVTALPWQWDGRKGAKTAMIAIVCCCGLCHWEENGASALSTAGTQQLAMQTLSMPWLLWMCMHLQGSRTCPSGQGGGGRQGAGAGGGAGRGSGARQGTGQGGRRRQRRQGGAG